MEFGIYRTIKVNGEYIDTLIAIVFNEDDAHTTVQAFRNKMGNQMCYYKEVK